MLHMTLTLTQSLSVQCQTERLLILSGLFNPSATCWIKKQNPQCCILNNEAPNTTKVFLINISIHYQFGSSKQYGVNTVKRVIETSKNHFISGFCSLYFSFSMQLQDQLYLKPKTPLICSTLLWMTHLNQYVTSFMDNTSPL